MSERVFISYIHPLGRIVIHSQREVGANLVDHMSQVSGVTSAFKRNRYSIEFGLGPTFEPRQVAAYLLLVLVELEGVALDDLEVTERGFPEGISIAHEARCWHLFDRIGELTRRIEELASEIRLNNAVLKRQRAELRTFRQELEELYAKLAELDDPVVETSESIDLTADNESSDES